MVDWALSPHHLNALGHSIPAINLLFASSLLLSGNNFAKIHLMAKYLGIRPSHNPATIPTSASTIMRGIDEFWAQRQAEVMEILRAKTTPVILSDICGINRHAINVLTTFCNKH